MKPEAEPASAIVLGLCVHGLAICRALNSEGVLVHAIECNINLPGIHTNSAKVHLVDSIEGDELVENLIRLHPVFAAPGSKVVLFPVNDNMVRTVAGAWEQLRHLYMLSWSECRSSIIHFLNKRNIEQQCELKGIGYPVSRIVSAPDAELPVLDKELKSFIAKPATPLSSFKVKRFSNVEGLQKICKEHPDSFPLIVQPWIGGDDTAIYFCALYLESGRPVDSFEGRKLLSNPPAMGQTTAAVSYENEELRNITIRFFEGTGISGPVSLEMKKDPDGKYWCIEPTVGRSDFWVDCCTQNAVNFPYIEFQRQTGRRVEPSVQSDRALWLDTETDPAALGTLLARKETRRWLLRKPAFAFMQATDPWPFVYGMQKLFRRKLSSPNYAQSATLPLVRKPFSDYSNGDTYRNLFEDRYWFDALALTMYDEGHQPFRFTAETEDGARFHFPLMERLLPLRRELQSLANYYTAVYSLLGNVSEHGIKEFVAAINETSPRFDVINIAPYSLDDKKIPALVAGLRDSGWFIQDYFCHGNWYLPCDGMNFDSYMRSMPSRTRNTIRRRTKSLEKAHSVRAVIHSTVESVECGIAAYETIYGNSWKQPEAHSDFIRDMVRWWAKNGWLRLGVLEIDGQPAAAQIWIVLNDTASIFKLAFDERFRAGSPGTVLSSKMFEHVLDNDNVTIIDYLTGDDGYKAEWMTHRRERWGTYAFNSKTISGLLHATRHILGRKLKRALIRNSAVRGSPRN